VLEFFAAQPPCVVALEACGGAHYWAREIGLPPLSRTLLRG
jgi:transposase